MKKFLIAVAALVVGGLILMGGCLALVGGAADEVAKEIDKGQTTGKVESGDLKGAEGGDGKDYSWKALQVQRGEFGYFAGSVEVTNTTDEAAEIFVSVTAYDGEQTLGSLDGSSRVKPGATTKVDLTSLEKFAKATDYEVEVSGF